MDLLTRSRAQARRREKLAVQAKAAEDALYNNGFEQGYDSAHLLLNGEQRNLLSPAPRQPMMRVAVREAYCERILTFEAVKMGYGVDGQRVAEWFTWKLVGDASGELLEMRRAKPPKVGGRYRKP